MLDKHAISLLRLRRDRIRQWLDAEMPYTMADQKHLDEATPERAYWHHGYQAALTDVMAMINRPEKKCGTADIPNPFRGTVRDGGCFPED